MTDTDERSSAFSGPKCSWCAYSAAAFPSLLNTTGRPSRTSSARRTSNPRQSSFAKFVAPSDEMTPSAVTGPGVSSPTARHVAGRDRRPLDDVGKRLRERLDGLGRAVADAAGRFGHLLDEELAGRVEHGRVDRGAASVESDNSPPIRFQHSARLPARVQSLASQFGGSAPSAPAPPAARSPAPKPAWSAAAMATTTAAAQEPSISRETCGASSPSSASTPSAAVRGQFSRRHTASLKIRCPAMNSAVPPRMSQLMAIPATAVGSTRTRSSPAATTMMPATMIG